MQPWTWEAVPYGGLRTVINEQQSTTSKQRHYYKQPNKSWWCLRGRRHTTEQSNEWTRYPPTKGGVIRQDLVTCSITGGYAHAKCVAAIVRAHVSLMRVNWPLITSSSPIRNFWVSGTVISSIVLFAGAGAATMHTCCNSERDGSCPAI